MSNMIRLAIGCAAATALLAGCSSLPSPAELDAQASKAIKGSFRDQSFVKTSWLDQDLGQKACSSDEPPDEATADRIMAEALYGVKWPAGGVYIGDWRAGERLAQSGRGMTWTDPSTETKNNGGNCYNCHQIDQKEISHGTIGPSLWNYGKNRGITDITAAATAPIVQYTWVKLWNSKAYAACSNMPRFGHKGLLDEQQLRDIMALLLDPKSPVNQ
jgi:L-cysteine S-thiosulfotransferase